MASEKWSTLLKRTGIQAENALEYVQKRAGKRLKPDQKLHVIAYRGFGVRTATGWQGKSRGRVLEYREAAVPSASYLWNNLRDSYARFGTDELAGVEVQGAIDGNTMTAVTDEEGYFSLVYTSESQPTGSTLSIEFNLPQHANFQLDGDPVISLPDTDAQFGVISDIDDTILVTEATSLLNMMRLTLLRSSASRVAFPGIARFYEVLHDNRNPFFYVSSSPWNLYEFLTDFMQLNGIVAGPLMLRDFGIDETKFIAGEHKDHKLKQIRTVLDTYPELSFVLSGDSGQDDPEIYTQIAQEYPGKILSIYIRDVSDEWRDRDIQTMIDICKACGVDMLLVPDSLAAAVHASSINLLPEQAIDSIAQATQADLAPA